MKLVHLNIYERNQLEGLLRGLRPTLLSDAVILAGVLEQIKLTESERKLFTLTLPSGTAFDMAGMKETPAVEFQVEDSAAVKMTEQLEAFVKREGVPVGDALWLARILTELK